MKSSTKAMLACGAVLLLLVGYGLYPSSTREQNETGRSNSSETASVPATRAALDTGGEARKQQGAAQDSDLGKRRVGENPNFPTLYDRLQAMQARRPDARFRPEDVLAAIQQPTAWIADHNAADGLNLSPEERRDGRMFLRLNPLKIETLMPGDTLEMPIAQRKASYTMVVDRVEPHGDGSVTWSGRLKEFEQENQVTITQSQGLTYAGVTLPSDSYVMQVNGEQGWLARGSSLFKAKVPNDIVLPPHEHDAPIPRP